MSGRSTHVIVVGGGVFGWATAYQLARRGVQTTLIERDDAGAHASGKNAGNLNPLLGSPAPLIPLALESFRLHQELAIELTELGCQDYSLTAAKRIHLAFQESERVVLDRIAKLFSGGTGFAVTWLEAAELYKLEPRLAPGITSGLLTEGNMAVDAQAFSQSLAEGAAKAGATLMRANVTGLETTEGRVKSVRTDCGDRPCDEVVFATGPWVAEVRDWLGLALPVEPLKGEMLRLRLPGENLQYDFTYGKTSLYRRGQEQVWLGVTQEQVGFDESPTAAGRRYLLEEGSRIMPAVREATVLEHTASLRPMTPTGLPLAGRAPGWKNVWLANGGGVKGVLLCTGIARAICDLLLTGETTVPTE